MAGIYNSNAFKNASGVQVVASANVEVRRESDSGLASIFSDRAGTAGIAQVAYPGTTGFKADANGYFEFFAEGIDGGYQVRVYSDDLVFDKTVRYQATGTARERDASSFGASVMSAADKAAALALLGLPSSVDKKIPIGDGTDYIAVPVPMGFSILNGYLAWTVAGNVLTVAVKNWAGADPSAADPVYIAFRDATSATGLPLIRKLTVATSISINDTATLGTINSTAFRLWCVAFDDAGTVRLALINCLSGTAPSLNIFPLAGWGIASSTLEDNASDSAHVFYSDGAAVASKAYATLGYATWETGLATAGTWSAGPTRAQLFGLGVPLPGNVVQIQRTQTGASSTGTTTVPFDDTIPQNTEGNELMTRAITQSSAANLIGINATVMTASSAASSMTVALFQDTTADALAVVNHDPANANFLVTIPIAHALRAGSTAPTTFKVRAGQASAGTLTFNGNLGTRKFGGAAASYLEAREIMA